MVSPLRGSGERSVAETTAGSANADVLVVLFTHQRGVSRVMSWTDRHQTEDAPNNDQYPNDEFDEWVQEGVEAEAETEPSGPAVDDAEDSSQGDQPTAASTSPAATSKQLLREEPLTMTQCPRCDGREFVSKKLVYEEFRYSEAGELEGHQNKVRAEFEFTCMDCGKRLHELPDSCRTFYEEVWVLKQDLRQALHRQLKLWAEKTRDRLRFRL